MKKRFCCLLICLLLLCCALSSACAENLIGQEYTSGNYIYMVQDDGTVVITKYTGTEVAVTVPDALDGIAVTAIGSSAFQANINITDVVIPEGIVSIGDSVFKRCTSLETVTLPDSLTEVGVNPFAGCESLLDVNVSKTSKNLRMVDGVLYSLNDCRLIYYSGKNEPGEYKIKQGTRIIGAEAFYECENITRVKIPKKSGEDH